MLHALVLVEDGLATGNGFEGVVRLPDDPSEPGLGDQQLLLAPAATRRTSK